MKLKYYLRGLGVGIICTAILMGIALSGNKKEKLTDTEIIERARLLGMVMAEEGQEEDGEGSPQDTEGQGQGSQEASAKGQEAGSKSQESQGAGSKSQEAGSQGQEGSAEGQKADSKSQEAGAKGQETGSKDQEEEAGSQSQDTKAQEDRPKNQGMVEFEITERDHSEDVSQKLFEAGLIQDASSFNQYMTSEGMDEHLQTGKYQIPAGATEDEILDMIVRLP